MTTTTSERLEEIKSFIEMAPNDPFPRYGLAMEYKNLGDLEEARRCFDDLLTRHPDYVPQYLMYGQMLVEMGQREAAKRILTSGIERAQKARNQHAQGEMQQALDRLEDVD
jgi:tetratricopeptide (TPR) repeat protein